MTAAGGRSASALRSTISPSRQSSSICGPLRTSNLACGWEGDFPVLADNCYTRRSGVDARVWDPATQEEAQ